MWGPRQTTTEQNSRTYFLFLILEAILQLQTVWKITQTNHTGACSHKIYTSSSRLLSSLFNLSMILGRFPISSGSIALLETLYLLAQNHKCQPSKTTTKILKKCYFKWQLTPKMAFGLQSALITYTVWEVLTIVKTSESQPDQTIQLIRHLLIGWLTKDLILIWTLENGRKTGLVQGYLQTSPSK